MPLLRQRRHGALSLVTRAGGLASTSHTDHIFKFGLLVSLVFDFRHRL